MPRAVLVYLQWTQKKTLTSGVEPSQDLCELFPSFGVDFRGRHQLVSAWEGGSFDLGCKSSELLGFLVQLEPLSSLE